jgi:hypothetical protein
MHKVLAVLRGFFVMRLFGQRHDKQAVDKWYSEACYNFGYGDGFPDGDGAGSSQTYKNQDVVMTGVMIEVGYHGLDEWDEFFNIESLHD